MSYSSGLGASIAQRVITAPIGLPRAGFTANASRIVPGPFRILPPECERVPEIVAGIYPTVAARQTVVVAWPLVTLTDEQIRASLDAIVASGAPGGGPAVLAGLSTMAGAATSSTTSQSGQVTPEQVKSRAIAMSPVFLAAGFIRDAEVTQSVTRGYLWLAATWTSPMHVAEAKQLLKAIVRASVPATALWRQAGMQPGKIKDDFMGMPIESPNESDAALETAAKESVVGIVQAANALAEVLATVLGSRTVSSSAVAMRNEFRTVANKMTNSAVAVDTIRALAPRVASDTVSALSQPPEAQASAGAALLEARRTLEASKRALLTGMQDARPVLATCAEEQSDRSPLAKRLRDAVYDAARSTIDRRDTPTVAREYAKCSLWRRAQRQLDTELRGLSAEIQGACLIANGLVNNAAELASLISAADAAIGQIDYTVDQLRMDWWQRNYMGVPVMYWIAGGAVAVVGGGIAIRTIRRRRRAASAAAPVTKNKRKS